MTVMKRAAAALIGLGLAAIPLVATQEPPAKESRTAYVRRLYERDIATHGDACRAVLSLVRDEPSEKPAGTIQRELAELNIVDLGWGLDESAKLTRGTLAYMLCKALGIKGGVTMAVFGTTRRYALRECIYLGLMSGGTVDEYVSGRELIDIIADAEVYKEEGSLDSLRK
jgi:hypothetical protein